MAYPITYPSKRRLRRNRHQAKHYYQYAKQSSAAVVFLERLEVYLKLAGYRRDS